MNKILLIEDEESLMDVLSMNLELEGYVVDKVRTGNDALAMIHNTYNLVVLDIMLPDVSGFDICEIIRKKSKVPILFISAKGTSADRIKGLTIGADDYLVKPFHLEEFLLRVKILVTRHSDNKRQTNQSIFTFGNNFSINFKTYEVTSMAGISTFSKREIDLLELLTSKKNEVVSKCSF